MTESIIIEKLIGRSAGQHLVLAVSNYGVVEVNTHPREEFYLGLSHKGVHVPLNRKQSNGIKDVTWTRVTCRATAVTIWDSPQGGRLLASSEFGSEIVATNGDFTIVMPPKGLIPIGGL